MPQDPREKFRIFISHKHDDHDFAANLAIALGGLSDKMKCFVSGTDLVAGSDWNAEIRSQLMLSHLLVLVFTAPLGWDAFLASVDAGTADGGGILSLDGTGVAPGTDSVTLPNVAEGSVIDLVVLGYSPTDAPDYRLTVTLTP